ncbi:MAG: hypothetical protein Q9202_006413 [Teloschistes flavicans]
MAQKATAQAQDVHGMAVELASFVKSHRKSLEESEPPKRRPFIPFAFTPELNYTTLLTRERPLPLLRAVMVHVPEPDWIAGSSIIHRHIGSLNGLEHSCEKLRSFLRNRSRKIESLLGQRTMNEYFTSSLDATMAKVAQAGNKLASINSRLQWRRVRVVSSCCKDCEAEQREDWTEMAEHWDHPPDWFTTTFARSVEWEDVHPFDLNRENMSEDLDGSGDEADDDSEVSSSKRALESTIEVDKAAKETIEERIKLETKRIKAKGSFNATYWRGHKAVSDLHLERHRLLRKISQNEFKVQGGDEEQWELQEKAGTHNEERAGLELKNQLLQKHLDRMGFDRGDENQQHRQWIMELITAIPTTKGGCGVGKEVGQGQRDNKEQSAFRADLIEVYDSEHEECEELRCPILSAYQHAMICNAAHVFPHSGGQLAMEHMFGRPDGREELTSIENGIIMSFQAEKRIANGWMVLIPNLSETATEEELDRWAKAEPKEYRIRVLDRDPKEMKEPLPPGAPLHQPSERRRSWWELDGEPVEFRTSHRPRARYLYWQFAVALLRKAYRSTHREANPIASEFGKRFWGTAGPWIRRKYLLGFVENLGHDLPRENLLEAAADDGENEECKASPAGVLQANRQLELVREKMEDGAAGMDPGSQRG